MFSNHLGLFTTLCQLQGNVEVVPSKDASLQSDDVGIVNWPENLNLPHNPEERAGLRIQY